MVQVSVNTYQVSKFVSFEVKEIGSGEALVFLHGLNGLKWDPFLDELSNQYRVIAPHIPGTGSSTGLENIRDLWELVLAYNDLFDTLGLKTVHLVGHSLGAMIAAEIAANNPERVKSLVLISPIGLFREEHHYDVFGMTFSEFARNAVVDQDSAIAKSIRKPSNPENPEEEMEWIINRSLNRSAAAKFLWPLPDKRLSYRIHRIQSPTFILWGKQDGIVPVVYAEEFHKLIENSELQIFEDASHMAHVEKKDDVLKLITDFIGNSNTVSQTV